MADTQKIKRGGGQNGGMHELTDATKHLRNDAKQLATSVGEITSQTQQAITTAMNENPYAVLGAAMGVGFVLGGGLRSRLAGALLMFGGRYLMNNMATQMLRRPPGQ